MSMDDDIAGPEGGNQQLLDVGCEADAIGRPVEQARSSNAAYQTDKRVFKLHCLMNKTPASLSCKSSVRRCPNGTMTFECREMP